MKLRTKILLILGGIFAIAILSTAFEISDISYECTSGEIAIVDSGGRWACYDLNTSYLLQSDADLSYMAAIVCGNGEIIKYNTGSGAWECNTDLQGSGSGAGAWGVEADYLIVNHSITGAILGVNITDRLCLKGVCISEITEINGTAGSGSGNCTIIGSCDPVFYNSEWDSEISYYWNMTKEELGWRNMTDYPTACSNQFVYEIGDTLTCSDVTSSYIATDAVKDDEIDYSAVTLADFTNDVSYMTSANHNLEAHENLSLYSANNFSITNVSLGNTAYNWGDHALAGYEPDISSSVCISDYVFTAYDGSGSFTCTADISAKSECSGSNNYLDGNGKCDELSMLSNFTNNKNFIANNTNANVSRIAVSESVIESGVTISIEVGGNNITINDTQIKLWVKNSFLIVNETGIFAQAAP